MTPKHHAILSSLAACKDGGIDMVRARLATLDDLEAGLISLVEALPLLRGAFTFLGQTVGTMHNSAAVLAEPMHMAEVPAPVAKDAQAAPEADPGSQADAKAEEPASSQPEQSSADPGPGLYNTRRKGDRTNV